jgi:hypothetical protein
MGLLARYTSAELATTESDASALRDVISTIGAVDGSLDPIERVVIESLFRTLPQLRDHPSNAPPRAGREHVLQQLAKLQDKRLREQCWVVAVELAIASDGINDAEDAYLESLRTTLRIDDQFAAFTVRVMASKYARTTAE